MGAGRPLQPIPGSDSGIKPQAGFGLGRKSGRKPLLAVLDGMDKAEAPSYVSRLFDSAPAGAPVWGDALLIKRFNLEAGWRNSIPGFRSRFDTST